MRSPAAKPNIRLPEEEEKPPLGPTPTDPERVVVNATGGRNRRERDAVEARLEHETCLLPRERPGSHRPREQDFDIAARRRL